MSSVKREIRHVHVVVVRERAEKCRKKHGARGKLLFCLSNLLFFLRSRYRPRRWILKSLMARKMSNMMTLLYNYGLGS